MGVLANMAQARQILEASIHLLRGLAFAVIVLASGCMGKDFSVCRTAGDLKDLPQSATDLRIRGISDDDARLLDRFSEVKELDFYGGISAIPMRLTSAGMRTISQHRHPKIKSILLDSSAQIDDDFVSVIAEFGTLEELVLRRSLAFGPDALQRLHSLGALSSLDLRGCRQIDDSWIATLGGFARLRRLHLTDTSVSPEGVAALRAAMPRCAIDTDPAQWAWALDD